VTRSTSWRSRFGLALGTATLFVCLTVGAAMAGEVTGPPGTPDQPFSGSGHRTGAFENANSICAFNGLNDMNPDQGPIHEITQNPHNQGSPGDAGHGTCAGGTNFERTK
jgi:hypothetical protein